jgi:hypothetical protein
MSKFKKRAFSLAAGALLAGGLGLGAAAGTAHAATVTASATTTLHARPDSGYAGNNWANDSMTRVSTVTLVGADATLADCGADATSCYSYTGTIADTGTAYAITGETSPGAQGVPIQGTPTAAITGNATVTFDASSDAPNGALVVTSLTGAGSTEQSTGNWVEQFFPVGTTFGSGPQLLPTWAWSYADTKDCQNWVDAKNVSPADSGDITGVDSCVTTVAPLGNQTVTIGTPASVQVFGATTSSDTALTYTASGLPAGLSIDATTGLISGTPTASAVGGTVNVTVADFGGLKASTAFGVTVNQPAPPPPPPPAKNVLSDGHVVSGTLLPTRATVAWDQSIPTADTLTINGPGAINGHVGHVPAGTTQGAYSGLESGHTYTVTIVTSDGTTGRVTFVTTK